MKRGFKEEDAEYTHGAVSCGGQWIMEVSPPRSKVIDIRKKYRGSYIKILRFMNEEYEEKGRYKIALWAVTQSNLRYDWFGVLRFKLGIFWQWRGRPFCSENMLFAMKWEYPRFTVLLPHECMPAHWLVFGRLDLHWEGIVE